MVAPSLHAPLAAVAVYGIASLGCFIAYARDKAAAERGLRRTPERTLLLWGLACGWPGGLLAQRWLRHKSAKTSFQIRFWFTVAVNIALASLLAWTLLLATSPTDMSPDTPPAASAARLPAA